MTTNKEIWDRRVERYYDDLKRLGDELKGLRDLRLRKEEAEHLRLRERQSGKIYFSI